MGSSNPLNYRVGVFVNFTTKNFEHIITTTIKMTYWADNIKFIKDVLDSKYKKIEDSLADLEEHMAELGKDPENKKIKDLFKEAAASLELINIDEIHTLAETMFADMPDSEKGKEQVHLAEIDGKRNKALGLIKDGRANTELENEMWTA